MLGLIWLLEKILEVFRMKGRTHIHCDLFFPISESCAMNTIQWDSCTGVIYMTDLKQGLSTEWNRSILQHYAVI